MRRTVLFVAVLLLTSGCDKAEGGGKSDAKLIQGTWVMTGAVLGGMKRSDEEVKAMKWKVVITSDTCTVKLDGGEDPATYKLDPSKKPKEIDLTQKKGGAKRKLLKGIYELNGDELKICWADDEKGERPTNFNPKKDSPVNLMVLKREK